MRWPTWVLVALIALLQYPLWLGKGSVRAVWELDRGLDRQLAINVGLKARNDALDADVRDLKTGYEAIEERARAELGMIRHDEVFFQIQSGGAGVKPAATRRTAPAR